MSNMLGSLLNLHYDKCTVRFCLFLKKDIIKDLFLNHASRSFYAAASSF